MNSVFCKERLSNGCVSYLSCEKLLSPVLVKNGYNVSHVYSGTLMTSLDGHGFSVTILKLIDDSWLKLLNTPSHISSLWKATTPRNEPLVLPSYKEFDETKADIIGVKIDDGLYLFLKKVMNFICLGTASKIEKALRAACNKLIESENLLNKLDSACGDGDCGQSLREASEGKNVTLNILTSLLQLF